MLKEATISETEDAARLALLLWPEHTLQEFIQEMSGLIEQRDAVVILAYHGDDAIGFAQCQLRYDYVEGTSSSPVGYLEGLYVKEAFRQQGYAKKLVHACERWAKKKSCQEFASDCELENRESLAVHLKLGFSEANRIICFKKML
ncbi:aminoglycoside 6'-N-acetyltransferase I [Bacillus thermophilus]|uniref:Aminoglycoside N(6')-acetyltransferase type 1 n=1 Tax=Siminovitchia thermophila TaxID=1245522 RepID=A0ABS2R174_9BACI|nr:aminoglycoside 6'-N-acetyltransferase [Siminovitchia thermophila]MBM7713388.1 aminoglycoside 6'-N-acetyltransferase I [Siminovitchia thermophila]